MPLTKNQCFSMDQGFIDQVGLDAIVAVMNEEWERETIGSPRWQWTGQFIVC